VLALLRSLSSFIDLSVLDPARPPLEFCQFRLGDTDGQSVYRCPPPSDDASTTSAMTREQEQALCNRVELLRQQLELSPEAAEQLEDERDEKRALELPPMTLAHLLRALEQTRPSVTADERKRYARIYADFVGSGGDFSASMHGQEQQQTLA
jgi:peroxin-1